MRSQLVTILVTSLGLAACAGHADLDLEDTGWEAVASNKGDTSASQKERKEDDKEAVEASGKEGPHYLEWKYFRDQDGDGHGDPASGMTAYKPPVGYVANDEDCDDGDADIHPGADERCNGLDDDCNGDVEEIHSYGGHDYAFCHLPGEETDFETARDRCADFPQEMDLAIITDEAERDFLRDAWDVIRLESEPVINHRGNDEYVAWIGYTDQTVEDIWVWADGYAHGYTDWCAGEPNDAGGEDCAVIGWTADYEYGPTCDLGWNDLDRDVLAPYICEVVD